MITSPESRTSTGQPKPSSDTRRRSKDDAGVGTGTSYARSDGIPWPTVPDIDEPMVVVDLDVGVSTCPR